MDGRAAERDESTTGMREGKEFVESKKDQDSCCLYRISGERKRLIQLFSTCHRFEVVPDRPLFHAPLSCFPGQRLHSAILLLFLSSIAESIRTLLSLLSDNLIT